MTASLVILCLAACTLVAALVSALVGASLFWLDRLATRIAPRHRVRLWLAVSGLPLATAGLAVAVSLLPAVGIGPDHCLAHIPHQPHHPHLCPDHVGNAPGIVLVLLAAWLALRGVYATVACSRGLRCSRETSELLAQASESRDDVLVFPSPQPQAFVLGSFRPRVHVSRGLLALGPDVVEPVLAHERVHARRRDLLWRALCPVLALGHFSSLTRALRARLAAAQEMAADAEAAEGLSNGRVKIAEALVTLARLARTPAPGLAFTHGDLKARVHALLEGRRAHPWCARLLVVGGFLVPVAIGACHDFIHHGLETLLGTLS